MPNRNNENMHNTTAAPLITHQACGGE